MKTNELRELGIQELEDRCLELSQEFFNLRFQKAIGQLSNTASIPKVKKEIARIKTILSEKSRS